MYLAIPVRNAGLTGLEVRFRKDSIYYVMNVQLIH
jgi:hypothetical protein